MTNEELCYVIPSIEAACLFYSHGRLNELLQTGMEQADGDFYSYYYELLDAVMDFVCGDYLEGWEIDKWYFSSAEMNEYYRLCRSYSSLHGIKLRDNPYMREAEQFVAAAMRLPDTPGNYGWHLQTGVRHKWAAGIVFYCDCYFRGECELLEVLLSVREWFEDSARRLKCTLEDESGDGKKAKAT